MKTAEQQIKEQILKEFLENNENTDEYVEIQKKLTGNTDSDFDTLDEDDWLQDYINEFRETGKKTDLKCDWSLDWSTHYDSYYVAKQLDNGTWVGWTYWYGGGKFGEPEAIDWMGEASILDVVSKKEITIIERKFKKHENI